MDRRRWNRLAKRFEAEVCDVMATGDAAVLRRLVARTRTARRDRVLADVGCGVGSFVLEFGPRFGEVIAVDYAEKILSRARRRCRGMDHVTWIAAGAEAAAKRIGARADLAVTFNVITSRNAARRERIWEGFAAVVKPGGWALIVLPSLESATMVARVQEPEVFARRRGEFVGTRDGLVGRSGAMQKHYTEAELVETCARHGLSVDVVRKVRYPWSDEGEDGRVRAPGRPWDWAVLARRRARRGN